MYGRQGSENSRMFKTNGLTYRVLDELGNKTGVPVKASAFYNKPILKYLEERFASNEPSRQQHKARIKNAIDLSFLKSTNPSLPGIIKPLERDGIIQL